MVYYFIYFLTKFVGFFLFPRKVIGWEHIPKTGGFIIACNHVSNLDPIVMGISCKRRINFMAKSELFCKQPFKFILPRLGAFPIKRGVGDFGAMKEAIKRLKNGWPVLIFVEGSRQKAGAMGTAQPGIGLVAHKSGAPVLPAYITGTEKAMPPGSKSVRYHPVTVTFGPPVKFDVNAPYPKIAQEILQGIYAINR